VTTLQWPVSCAWGIVETAVELFALTWQPPRLQNPWYTQPGRFWYGWDVMAAGPGNACHPSVRATATIRCFNPVYGQGMSVAAQETRRLGQLLAERASMADLALPGTRGERPPDFEQRLQMGLAMGKLAAQDPAVHKLMAEVTSLLKPRSVYQDPALMERVREVMAAG